MSRLTRRREERISTSTLKNPAEWLRDALSFGPPSSSGVRVTQQTALSLADVYACVRAITDEVYSIPLRHYDRIDENSSKQFVPVPGSPAWVLDHPAPGLLTAGALWALVVMHLNLSGNSFLAKYRNDPNGPVMGMFPISPSRVRVTMRGLEPIYRVSQGDGSTLEGEFNRRDILHFKGMTLDGLVGLSPIAYNRQTLGRGIAQEDYAGRVFANDATPRGILYTKLAGLNDANQKRLKAEWDALRGGENRGGVALLDKDKDEFKPISLSPSDLSFIEQMRLTTGQIARIHRVPPWVIGASSGDPLTYKTVEGQQLGFAMSAIRPWLVNLEETIKADGDFYSLDGSSFCKFWMDAMLRADSSSRAQVNNLGVGRWITPNEIRREEGLPDIEGGDELAPSKKEAPPAAVAPTLDPAGDPVGDPKAIEGAQP